MLQNIPYDVINGIPFSKFAGLTGSNLYLINTMSEWKAFYEILMKKKIVACDTETSGFQYFRDDRIIGMSFGWGSDNFYIPVRHLDSALGGPVAPQISMDDIRADLQAFFSRQDVVTIWWNYKFDRNFYHADGIKITTPYQDLFLWWKLYNENAPARLKTVSTGWTDELGRKVPGIVGQDADGFENELDKWRSEEAKERRRLFSKIVMSEADRLCKEVAYQSFNRNQLKKHIKETILKDHEYNAVSKDSIHYGYVPINLMTKYAATDTYLTFKALEYLTQNSKFSPELTKVYKNELELCTVLANTELGGIKIDRKYMVHLSQTLAEEIEALTSELQKELAMGLGLTEEEIDSLKGEGDINLNSTDQLVTALQTMGVVFTKKSDTGKICLDKKVLQKLSGDYPIVKKILDLRFKCKMKSTYVDSIIEKLVLDDMLHCSFNQNVSTGRMSSTSPNLQNISNKDDTIRRAFICPEGFVYIFADYSQIEVRLTAHHSQDPLLLDAYKKGQDVHTRTMCEMFDYDYDEVEEVLAKEDKADPRFKTFKELRNIAKRINFGIIYGVGAPGLSEQIERPARYAHLSQEEWVKVCQSFIDLYLEKYIGVKRFINASSRLVAKNGYVVNSFGRVRHLPHAHATKILKDDTKFWLEARAKRQGVNFLVQGDAAEVFKMSAVRVAKILEGTKSRIVNFVHDEIQIYLHTSEFHLLPLIKAAMEDWNFRVPIIADIEYSTTNWAEKRSLH